MKIKQSNSKKKILLTLLVIGLLIGAGAAYWFVNRDSEGQKDGANHNPPSQTEKDAGKQSKDEAVNKDTSSNSSKENTPANRPSTASGKTVPIPMRITASSQNDSVYQIRTLIDQVVNGTCTMTLTKATNKITKSATTQALAQASTCQGFDIPISELSTGTWQVSISLEGPGITGITSGTIEIK